MHTEPTELTIIEETPPAKRKSVIKLTTAEVDGLSPGLYWDTELKGFGVRVSPKLKRTFFMNGYVKGVRIERRVTIGDRESYTEPRARRKAQEIKRQLNDGVDLMAEARERRDAPTMTELAERYLKDHHSKTAAGRVPGSARDNDVRGRVRMVVDAFGPKRKVVDAHQGDAQALHAKVTEERGSTRANRVVDIGSSMFTLAMIACAGEAKPWRPENLGNPFSGVKRNPESKRERIYSEKELAAIARELEVVGKRSKQASIDVDIIRLVTFTGCRPCEAFKATWGQLDEQVGYWKKPASNTKQRKDHKLVLNQQALELVDRLRETRDSKVTLVFPRVSDGDEVRRIDETWHKVCAEAGIKKNEKGELPRVYDLRHTVATLAAKNFSLPLVGALLGHSSPATTARYVHLDNAVQEATDHVGKAIAAAGNGN
jgi:integrase